MGIVPLPIKVCEGCQGCRARANLSNGCVHDMGQTLPSRALSQGTHNDVTTYPSIGGLGYMRIKKI